MDWERSRSHSIVVDKSPIGEGTTVVWLNDWAFVVDCRDTIAHIQGDARLKYPCLFLGFGYKEHSKETNCRSQQKHADVKNVFIAKLQVKHSSSQHGKEGGEDVVDTRNERGVVQLTSLGEKSRTTVTNKNSGVLIMLIYWVQLKPI